MAISMEGPLSKWTNVVKGWQYRWFVLDETVGLLSYYTSKEKMMRGARRGCLRLKGALLGIDDEDDSTFTISCDQKTFHFQARDAEEREKWIGALETTIMKHSHSGLKMHGRYSVRRAIATSTIPAIQLFGNHSKAPERMHAAGLYSVFERRHVYCECQGVVPFMFGTDSEKKPFGTDLGLITSDDDLDKRLLEAEAYFKLFTEQIKTLHAQIDKDCEDQEPSERYQIVKETSTKMLENIGQSLEMMHSVKEACESCPVIPSSKNEKLNQDVDIYEDNYRNEAVSPTFTTNGQFGIPIKTPPSQMKVRALSGASPTISQTQRMADAFPTISYSSSEDEDEAEFFDATEYDNDTSSTGESNRSNFGAFHEDEDDIFGAEIEGDDIRKHGSIITHLLSQVRLGMDLTKVVLPTFILERRSLLEMYADFLAHPDLFVSVCDYTDAKDRIVQVLKWYLSAFHAGRKSSIAKKPYNPILGETFSCHYVLDENDRSKELTTDGPQPGISKDDVSFIAEQVSHHPPISAFYGEHQNKNIYFNGHIWTKSKFLGLSIGVEMCGQACISVLPYNEEYIVTFPNGYGRSILTVPWMELGGQTSITCAQTGYSATIHFHCKPFYGGKKHRVSADIMAPGEKKSFLSISGEWNGVMYCKDPKDNTEPTEVFIDTKTMPVVKKRVTPLDKQGEYESRRLWRDVTSALKDNDVDSATAAKHKLEERQRAEARERKEKGEKWKTKLFHDANGPWTYSDLLKNRYKQNEISGCS